MALTVFELPGYLRETAQRIGARAPIAAANGMANAYQGYVVRSMRGPAPSPPGRPPARRSGTLARSVRPEPAVSAGAYRARSSVAPHTVYARIQNEGGVIWAKHTLAGRGLAAGVAGPQRVSDLGYLRFQIGGVVHYRRSVTLPPRPYMVMTSEARQLVHDGAISAVRGVLP